MTGLEKVAVLLKSLPPEVAAKVMRHLEPRHAGLVSSAVAKLAGQGDLSQKLAGVLDEIVNLLGNGARSKDEPSAKAPAIVAYTSAAATPPAAAKTTSVDIRLAEQPDETPKPPPAWLDPRNDPIKALAAVPPDLLAAALDSENGRTISLLMNRLEIESAGQLYKRLSPAKRKEVSLRFTEQTVVGDELIKRIAQGVLKKCQALSEASGPTAAEPGGREKRMAALLRGLERAERLEMLTALGEADADLTGRVKALLYQFEDVLRLENTSVQKLLSEVDVKSLALALRGAPQDIEAKILTNLSKRAQESLKEEISLTGAVPGAKVRAARQTLEEALQRLDQRGELVQLE